MDKLLHKFRWRIACCFIDDIIIFSDTFEAHVRDLDDVLTILKESRLIIQLHKCLVGYHSLKLLGQLINHLGLTTTKERAEAILKQTYPETLDQLETFLDAYSYNRHLVPYYTQITSSLQSLKIRSFKEAPKLRCTKKKFAEAFKLPPPTSAQKKAFDLIKSIIESR